MDSNTQLTLLLLYMCVCAMSNKHIGDFIVLLSLSLWWLEFHLLPNCNHFMHCEWLTYPSIDIMSKSCHAKTDAGNRVMLSVQSFCVDMKFTWAHSMFVSVNIQCIFQMVINCLQQPFGWHSSLCSLPAYRMDTPHTSTDFMWTVPACVRLRCAISINKTKLKHP